MAASRRSRQGSGCGTSQSTCRDQVCPKAGLHGDESARNGQSGRGGAAQEADQENRWRQAPCKVCSLSPHISCLCVPPGNSWKCTALCHLSKIKDVKCLLLSYPSTMASLTRSSPAYSIATATKVADNLVLLSSEPQNLVKFLVLYKVQILQSSHESTN